MLCDEKDFIIRIATPVVPIKNVFSTRKVSSGVQGEDFAAEEKYTA